MPKEDEQKWVTLSLTPSFTILGKRLGKKMNDFKMFVNSMSHGEAVACPEKGALEFEDVIISSKDELVSKLSFSMDGDQWEATTTLEGDVVLAIDCTQDEAILLAGRSRELINAIQQMRKLWDWI